ncbi:MAG: hypothetical protein MSA09_00145 [Lachnospiraceae bacterium]|nr:hypothetical protein [Lachnospiraceae bacterium]
MGEIKRRKISKAERIQIYDKCNYRCAYCGCDLEYKDMPLGPTEQYARIIGNIYDNPELKVDERYRHGGL